MAKITDIFDVWYGVNLEVVNCEIVDRDIPFVSRQSVNNGVVCHVKRIDNVEPNPSHTLSIAVSGSVLSTFYHDYEYYSGRDVYIARPKIQLNKYQMIYYAYIIEQNKYRYNYGRGANRTFRNLEIPSFENMPVDLALYKMDSPFIMQPLRMNQIKLTDREWRKFRYDEIFSIRKGFYNKKPNDVVNGNIPFIGATDSNNGITSMCDLETIEQTSKTGDGKNVPINEKIYRNVLKIN